MFKRNEKQPVRIRIGYEVPIGDEVRRYETDAEIVIKGETLAGLTQAVEALGDGLLALAERDRTNDWRNRPRFEGLGE